MAAIQLYVCIETGQGGKSAIMGQAVRMLTFCSWSLLLLQEAIEAIAESAFKTSPYPIILSFENHVDSCVSRPI